MYYSSETESMISKISADKPFEPNLQDEILKIFQYRKQFSPLSDIRSIIRREKNQLEKIIFSADSSERFPIRNIIRLICKLSTLESAAKIKNMFFKEMRLGCDYFSGKIVLDTEEKEIMITYDWCWTDFNRGIGFDRFPKFEITEI